MDNFDLKKYLNNNPLLKEENPSEDNIVSENLLRLAKKYIKDKHNKDVTNDQISFDSNVDMKTVDDFLTGKLTPTFNIPGLTEGELSEGKKKKMLRALCHVAVYVVASIFQTFVGIFARAFGGVGDGFKFIKALYNNDTDWIVRNLIEPYETPQDFKLSGRLGIDKEFPDHWHFRFFTNIPKKSLNLFWTMCALAIRIFQITGSGACATLLAVDYLPAYILDKVRDGFGMHVDPKNTSRLESAINKIINKNNPFTDL
jgi:hypothetical protein